MYNYFNPIQDPKMVGLDSNLMTLLNSARDFATIPFIITSGLRTDAESIAVGGFAGDPHTKGLACDILCKSDTQQYLIVNGALKAGFKRIGLGLNHVHLDIDSSQTQNVIWIEKNAV